MDEIDRAGDAPAGMPAAPGRVRGSAPAIAVVVPALDEEDGIGEALASIGDHAQVVVVDGGSSDATPAIAARAGAVVVSAPRGRASQMNAGVAALSADWDVVIFLHADTRLPTGWAQAVERVVVGGAGWGRFDIVLPSRRRPLALVAHLMNARSRLTGICTGDQALFVTRVAWERVGGYPPIALMEDIEISRRLKRCAGPPAALRERVRSSARRWERRGIVRTILGMWALRLRHFLGESPDSLHRRYYGKPGR